MGWVVRLGQIRLLLWKNAQLQRRRPIGTLLELCVPLVLFLLLLVIRNRIQSEDVPASVYPPMILDVDVLSDISPDTLVELNKELGVFGLSNQQRGLDRANATNVLRILQDIGRDYKAAPFPRMRAEIERSRGRNDTEQGRVLRDFVLFLNNVTVTQLPGAGESIDQFLAADPAFVDSLADAVGGPVGDFHDGNESPAQYRFLVDLMRNFAQASNATREALNMTSTPVPVGGVWDVLELLGAAEGGDEAEALIRSFERNTAPEQQVELLRAAVRAFAPRARELGGGADEEGSLLGRFANFSSAMQTIAEHPYNQNVTDFLTDADYAGLVRLVRELAATYNVSEVDFLLDAVDVVGGVARIVPVYVETQRLVSELSSIGCGGAISIDPDSFNLLELLSNPVAYAPYGSRTARRIMGKMRPKLEGLANLGLTMLSTVAQRVDENGKYQVNVEKILQHYQRESLPVTIDTNGDGLPDVNVTEAGDNFYRPFVSIDALEGFAKGNVGAVSAAFVFDELPDDVNRAAAGASAATAAGEDQRMPRHISYAIRLPTDTTPNTRWIYPHQVPLGPRCSLKYYLSGFLLYQNMLERSIIELHDEDTAAAAAAAAAGGAASSSTPPIPKLMLEQFPYPAYRSDRFTRRIALTLPLLFTLAWIYTCANIVKNVVYEKVCDRSVE